MIEEYIHKLIDNLPDHIKSLKNPLLLYFIFDGGMFNGSYLIGICMFLKEMEKRNYIKIDRISGCSVGSFISLLYVSNNLDYFINNYDELLNSVKKDYNLEKYKLILNNLIPLLPKNLSKSLNNKLFINFYNVKKCKTIVKNKYKNNEEIIDAIIKSSFVPFVINGNMLYKNKFIDGFNPYIFPPSTEKKALFIDLRSWNKIFDCFNVKNEKTNFHRILTGVLDVHNFFIKDSKTDMCSYVNYWNIIDKINFYYIKKGFEKFIVYLLYYFILFKKVYGNRYFDDLQINKSIIYKLLIKIMREIYITVLDNYLI